MSDAKIWEKAWNSDELKDFSTAWSLAGDSGLLLNLKQFSENLMSRSVTIEKKLQKLVHDEQQCQIKLNNATSSFLMLENSQFIENRVYEDEVLEKKVEEIIKEKTKEEKEAELFSKITEACEIGMSIMDKYFDKLSAKDLKRKKRSNPDEDDEEDDDDDEEDVEENQNEKNTDELIIYETKDPYVLRSLPYLIGSQAFLDNDHVGLRDLDSDEEIDEESDEDHDQIEEEEDKNTKPKKPSSIRSESSSESSSDDELFGEAETTVKKVVFEKNSDGEKDDNDIFKSFKKKKASIFDDDSEDEDEPVKATEKVAIIPEIKIEPEEMPKVVKPLDFSAELSMKLANKQSVQPINPAKIDQVQPLIEKPTLPVVEPKTKNKVKNLFSDESDDEDLAKPDIFSSKKSAGKNLFDDSDDEDDLKKLPPIEKELTIPPVINKKLDLSAELNGLFMKKQLDQSKAEQLADPIPTKPLAGNLNSESTKITKTKISLFDDDDEEDDVPKPVEIVKVSAQSTKEEAPKKASTLFDTNDEDDDDIFTTSKIMKPEQPKQAKKVTLFSDSSDTSPEDQLFTTSIKRNVDPVKAEANLDKKPLNQAKINTALFSSDTNESSSEEPIQIIPRKESLNVPDKKVVANKSLFESDTTESSNEEPNLFKPRKISILDKPQEKNEIEDLFLPAKKESETVKKNVIEPVKPLKKSLFSSSTEDEETDDLFKVSKVTSVKQKEDSKPDVSNLKTTDLFQDPLGNLDSFAKVPKVETKQKDNLFEDEEDFKPKATTIKNIGKNLLFSPNALAGSSLFQKITQENQETKDVETDKVPIDDKLIVSDFTIKKTDTNDSLNEEPFGNLKVDNAFSEQSLKNAQKDRIKVNTRKKRPQTKRKSTEASIEQDIFDTVDIPETKADLDPVISDLVTEDTQPEKITVQEESAVKHEQPPAKPATSIFDTLAEDNFDDLDLFKPIVKKKTTERPKKDLLSIFDDDTDIFSDMPAAKPTATVKVQPKPKENKAKSTMKKAPEGDIFGDMSDDDIFSTFGKK